VRSSPAQLLAEAAVEVGERPVHEEQPRLDDQRAGEGDALLLAAGQLRRPAAALGGAQADAVQHRLDAPQPFRPRDAPHLQAEGQVGLGRQVREEGVVLEHHAHVAPLRRLGGHVPAIQHDGAGVGMRIAADQAQERRLAAAGGAGQGEKRPRRYAKVKILDGRRTFAEGVAQPVEAQ
jgi:hypothetical protein